MTAYFLKNLLNHTHQNIHIASAGIGALVGHQADEHVLQILKDKGIDASEHRAQQLSAELAAHYDLILVMEKGHIHAVTEIAPQVRGRVHLLGKWNNNEEIADPYQKSEAHFKAACSAIERNIELWRKYL